MTAKTRTTSFDNRTRFNWGFHDGAADFNRGRENKWSGNNHFDTAYKVGYLAGYAAAKFGESVETSDNAWANANAWGDI